MSDSKRGATIPFPNTENSKPGKYGDEDGSWTG